MQIVKDKQEARRLIRNARRAYPNDLRLGNSWKITDMLCSSELYKNCSTVLVFISTRIEVDTSRFIERAFADGKTVVSPRCVPDTSVMKFYEIRSLDDLDTGSYELMEPKEGCPPFVDDGNSICIVPGLTYDINGYRIGFGRGYYDYFLSSYDGISCGVCFDEFIEDELPRDDGDCPVNYIFTPTRIIKTDNGR